MQQTKHCNLTQWELSDPIKMEDFNADNAKIDAALKDLDKRAGTKLDFRFTQPVDNQHIPGYFFNIPWDTVSIGHMVFDLDISDGEDLSCFIKHDSKPEEIFVDTIPAPTGKAGLRRVHFILFPMYNPQQRITFYAIGTTTPGFHTIDFPYEGIHHFDVDTTVDGKPRSARILKTSYSTLYLQA